MPHFDSPKRDRTFVGLVRETLEKSFASKGLKHRDVRWENIGEYEEGGERKAVVFDLEYVVEDSHGGDVDKGLVDWVEKACNALVKSVEKN